MRLLLVYIYLECAFYSPWLSNEVMSEFGVHYTAIIVPYFSKGLLSE